MTAQRFNTRLAFTTAAAAAALFLAGCGAGTAQSQTSGTPESSPASSSSSPAASAPAASAAATGTAASTAAPASSAPAGPALCKAAGLTATVDSTGGGAAGSVYMKLILTNSGTGPCLLKGFAGVSLTANATGAPIGAAAARDESTPAAERPARAGPGRRRHAALLPGRQLPGLQRDSRRRLPCLPAGGHRVALRRPAQERLQQRRSHAADHQRLRSQVAFLSPR